MALRLRDLTDQERTTIEHLAQSRTAPARLVERARIIWYASQKLRVPAIAQRVGLNERTVRMWFKRFERDGLSGLNDAPRSGRPVTYTGDVVALVIASALTDPQKLGLPFACWTLDRLERYLNEQRSIPIKRSRIDDILLSEGLRWRQQETWVGEKVDPDFAKKRGPSKRSTPRRQRAVSS
jgi:transposase